MIQIILNEWKMLLRVRVLIYLSVLFIIGLTSVTWLGTIQNNSQQEQQKTAQTHVRDQWEDIEAMNPHGAAHFGSYAFKPVSFLSSIDEGVNAVTGNVLRLEGHVQNEMAYSEASQSMVVSKFGKLKPSLLLQYVIPLFLIFLAFTSISSEKDVGRLKFLVFQGASLVKLILAKSLSVWFYGFLLLIVTIMVQAIVIWNTDIESFKRLLFLLFAYSLYYYIIATIATYLSARLKNNTAALSSMLAIWILWTIFLPKIWGNTTDKLNPLPSRQEFKTAMQEDRSKGIDGHNPFDERQEALKQQVLKEYGVEDVEDLPINFDGLRMQADEDFGNDIWDKHFGNNYHILQEQKKTYQLSGIFNPFASLQSASMGFSGSDMHHHLDFLKQAELYRRHFIKELNDKHAYGGSKTGDWSWEADSGFYKSVDDFEYKTLPVKSVASHYLIDLLFLSLWAMSATFIVLFTTKKIKLS